MPLTLIEITRNRPTKTVLRKMGACIIPAWCPTYSGKIVKDHQKEFLDLALEMGVLRFGEFTLKSGRVSPYFFNAGLFCSGRAMAVVGRCYAQSIVDSGLKFDILFGPAYKGIPLAAVTAAALAEKHDRDLAWAYNRKEAKEHGEGGVIIGAPLAGRVLILDDVITAGTAIREAVEIIRNAGRQTPQVRTWTATCPGPGSGSANWPAMSAEPGRSRTIARIHAHDAALGASAAPPTKPGARRRREPPEAATGPERATGLD